MQKTVLFVIGALLFCTITACNKVSVEPDDPSLDVNFNSLKTATTPKNNIVILGGSTAWGKGASAPENTWVNKLRVKLRAVDKSDTIINLAFPGYSTYHIMATGFVPAKAKRPETDTTRNITTALSKHPMLVIISLPSNDIASGFSDEETLGNYKTIVNTLNSQKIPYILTSNQPRDFETLAEKQRLRTFTDLLVKTFPGHVVDYLNILGDNCWAYKVIYDSGDGIHPNDSGHNVIMNSMVNFMLFRKVVGMK